MNNSREDPDYSLPPQRLTHAMHAFHENQACSIKSTAESATLSVSVFLDLFTKSDGLEIGFLREQDRTCMHVAFSGHRP